MKKLSGHHFADVIAAVDHFLEVLDANFFKEGISMLHDSLTKFINAESIKVTILNNKCHYLAIKLSISLFKGSF